MNVLTNIKKKRIPQRFSMLFLSLLLSAIIYNVFVLPINLVTGGSGGIATITNYVYGIDPSLMILIVSLICILFSLMYLGIEATTGTIIASLLYPFLVKLTQPLAEFITIDFSDLFIIVIIAGVLSGISNGLMYKSGYSNGGLPVIGQILYKYYKIPVAKTSLVSNLVIVFIGGIFFGWTKVMYAIILLYINSLFINKILLGTSQNKAFYIITNEDDKVKNYIIKELGQNATIFDVKGGFLEKKDNVILTVIPTMDYYKLTAGIRQIDKDAFFLATDSYEVVKGKKK